MFKTMAASYNELMETKTYQKDEHAIIQGDAVNALQGIANNSVDLIFADPPYNIGKNFNGLKDKKPEREFLDWTYKWIELCIKKLKPSGSFYLMCSTQYMPYLDIYVREQLKMSVLSRIVWHYDSSGVQAKKYYGSMYEPILFIVKDPKNYTFNGQDILVQARTGATRKLIDYRGGTPKPYNDKKVPGNVWEFPRVRYRMPEYEEHPTQKPIKLLERIIRASSNEGDLVLDPFSGSFTTSYVAKMLNRKSIGIEISEEYVKIGLRRLEIATHHEGEELKQPEKTFKPKRSSASNQLGLEVA